MRSDAVAFTRGPGLLGSLLVGTSFAKGFTAARGIPMIEVNHLQAHILVHFIQSDLEVQDRSRLSVSVPSGIGRTYPAGGGEGSSSDGDLGQNH